MDAAGSPSHLRTQSEAKRSLRPAFLPDSSAIYGLTRLPKEPSGRTSLSPTKLSRSYLFNDSGSDMFKLTSERKETSEQLKSMENRIKSLQLAELKAKKKLEETKKIAQEKTTLKQIKQRELEEKRHWRDTIETQRQTERIRIERERLKRKQNLQLARDSAVESKRVVAT